MKKTKEPPAKVEDSNPMRREEEKMWFGEEGLRQLSALQQRTLGAVTSVIRTMIAAYRQFEDVDYLLAVIATHVPKSKLKADQADMVDKIAKRHIKYARER